MRSLALGTFPLCLCWFAAGSPFAAGAQAPASDPPALVEQADALRTRGTPEDVRQAIAWYERALAAGGLDRSIEAAARLGLGRAHQAIADHRQALAHFDEALRLFRAGGDARQEAAVLDLMATVHMTLWEHDSSLQRFNQALAIREALDDRRGTAQTLSNLALLYTTRAEYDRALEQYRRALPMWEALGDRRSYATTLHNLGELYLLLGDYTRSLEYSRQALAWHREVGPPAGLAHVLEHIGSAHAALGDDALALEYFEQGLAATRSLPSRWLEADALDAIGRLHARQGDHAQAAAALDESLAMRRTLGSRGATAATLAYLGGAQRGLGRLDEAAASYREALESSRAVFARRTEAVALGGLARLAADAGRLDEARRLGAETLDLVETLRIMVSRPDLRTSYLATTQDDYRRQIDVLFRLHGRDPAAGHDRAAFAVAERARARGLLDTLADARADLTTTVDPALGTRERELRAALTAAADGMTALAGAGPTADAEARLEAARARLNDLRVQYADLQGAIRAASPSYGALVHPRPLDADAIQVGLLDAETLLVQFVLADDRGYAWAISRHGLQSYTLPPRLEIERAARRLIGGIRRAAPSSPDDGNMAAEARRLGEWLLGPIRDLDRYRRLAVVADGALEYVPFGVLEVPAPVNAGAGDAAIVPRPDAGDPLIVSHEVVRLPSASVLALLRDDEDARLPSDRGTLAVFADPVFHGGDPRVRAASKGASPDPPGPNAFTRLRFSRQEALEIAALVPPDSAFVGLDFDATRAAAVDPALARFRLVHFATHGIIDAEHPELSALVLSQVDREGRPDGGLLRLHDIYNLRLGADLVVLSGCETALGRSIRGEGLIGLTRGFMHAGAPRVIASLWQVEDRATALLMARLYRGLLEEGLPPAAALRRAQLGLRADPRWEAPYFWAGFELQGDWR